MAITSSLPIPNILTKCSVKSITDRWDTTTPFGVPVEPEVKFVYRGSTSQEASLLDFSTVSQISCSARSSANRIFPENPSSRTFCSSFLPVTRTSASRVDRIVRIRSAGCSGSTNE